MNVEDLEKHRRQITTFVKKNWRKLSAEQREDCVSFAVEEWLRGRDPQTSYQYIIIDYLRSHEMRVGARGPSDALAQPNRSAFDTDFDRFTHDVADSPKLTGGFESLIRGDRKIAQLERCIMKLRFEWGFSNAEIGDCFGVTESRISQRVTAIQTRIQKTLSTPATAKPQNTRPRTQAMAQVLPFEAKRLELKEAERMARAQSFKVEGFNAASF